MQAWREAQQPSACLGLRWGVGVAVVLSVSAGAPWQAPPRSSSTPAAIPVSSAFLIPIHPPYGAKYRAIAYAILTPSFRLKPE